LTKAGEGHQNNAESNLPLRTLEGACEPESRGKGPASENTPTCERLKRWEHRKGVEKSGGLVAEQGTDTRGSLKRLWMKYQIGRSHPLILDGEGETSRKEGEDGKKVGQSEAAWELCGTGRSHFPRERGKRALCGAPMVRAAGQRGSSSGLRHVFLFVD